MLLKNYRDVLVNSAHDFSSSIPDSFLLFTEGEFQTFYAPFEHVNASAKIVICGITPGLQQAVAALTEARRQLSLGQTLEIAAKAAKATASFSGPMRSNLIQLLDSIGVAGHLKLASCAALFTTHVHLVHYTSALRYPVFHRGKNYSGAPSMLRNRGMRQQIDNYLTLEVQALGQDCLYVPLGPKVTEVFDYLASEGLISESQILAGLPHPSGANAERISYFLGNKSRESLSAKTNPILMDRARETLVQKVEALRLCER